jgi:hypothetical protein
MKNIQKIEATDQLIQAATAENEILVDSLISEGADVNTALGILSRLQNEVGVDLLISKGANVSEALKKIRALGDKGGADFLEHRKSAINVNKVLSTVDTVEVEIQTEVAATQPIEKATAKSTKEATKN